MAAGATEVPLVPVQKLGETDENQTKTLANFKQVPVYFFYQRRKKIVLGSSMVSFFLLYSFLKLKLLPDTRKKLCSGQNYKKLPWFQSPVGAVSVARKLSIMYEKR